MSRRLGTLGLLFSLIAAAPLSAADTYAVDKGHSSVEFRIRHFASKVNGRFSDFEGSIQADPAKPEASSVAFTIKTASIDTNNGNRDNDLRSPNFLDVAKYPTITFKSTKVEKAGQGKLKVTGNLTLHGVTKPVVLDVEGPTAPIKDPGGHIRRGLSASTTINRKDFGLEYNKMIEAGPVVGDQVKIEIEAELIKQEAKQAAN